MKKYLIMIVALLLLTACGSKDELIDFTERFNENTSGSVVAELEPEDFEEEIKEVGGMGWKELFKSEECTISAKYADLRNVSGYHVSIDIEHPFESVEGVVMKRVKLLLKH